MSVEQNLLIEVQRAAVRFPDELSSLLNMNVSELKSAIGVIPKPTTPELIEKLTKAMHLNEKLSYSAMGVDATIHQYIDDELKSVINIIK